LQHIHGNPGFNPRDSSSWPLLLRVSHICKQRGRDGILPLTQSAFRDAVARGLIEPPIRFGARVNCWPRDYILRLQQRAIPRRDGKFSIAEAAEHRRPAGGGG
jgi:hypothetical protein